MPSDEKKKSGKRNPWLKLDNAGKIYPPASTRSWSAMFRLSITLTEPIDPVLLKRAQASVLKRIPTFAYRIRRGLFWHYLEHMGGGPDVQPDVSNPMVHMVLRRNGHFMFRVRYYDCRIAVEIFHALTDGTGGLTFLMTLAAEYLRLKRGARIPAGGYVLDVSDKPKPVELADAFLDVARGAGKSRSESAAYCVRGEKGEPGYLQIITGLLPAKIVRDKAREYGVSVTVFLVSVMMMALQDVQKADPSARRRRQPIKISVPVNLRRIYDKDTLRNFASYVNVGIDPALGEYAFDEVLSRVKHTMAMEVQEKSLNAKISQNVNSERNPIVRAMPLAVKSPFMRTMFALQGERYVTTTISNLGLVALPPPMARYVRRLDFALGAPARNAVVCGVIAYGNMLSFTCSRILKDPVVERAFFRRLIKLGVPVKIESNQNDSEGDL